MYFGNCSQNYDFIFNEVNITNSCEEKMSGVISDYECGENVRRNK